MSSNGQFTIPTRVYLTDDQRQKLMVMVRQQQVDLPDLLTELLVSFLDHLPDTEKLEMLDPQPEEPQESSDVQLKRRRSELRRLRTRIEARGTEAPPWFAGYVTQLEREIKILEESVAQDPA